MQDRALAFAARLISEADENDLTDDAVIRRAFRLTLGRRPSSVELEACRTQWSLAEDEESAIQPAKNKFPTSIERTVMAEKTGEPYTFTEHLPAYESYVPDLQRSQCDARTRGLSHVCLVLLNLNEFAYLD